MNRNMEKEATTKKLPESEISPNEVTIEVIEKGELDGEVSCSRKKGEYFSYIQVICNMDDGSSPVWRFFRSAYSILGI